MPAPPSVDVLACSFFNSLMYPKMRGEPTIFYTLLVQLLAGYEHTANANAVLCSPYQCCATHSMATLCHPTLCTMLAAPLQAYLHSLRCL